MPTDTSERGLERLICTALTGDPCEPPPGPTVGETRGRYGGVGWHPGNRHDYNREYCVDLVQLTAFLQDTQPEIAESLCLSEDGPVRHTFLARLQGEITKRGTLEVLRDGVKHKQHDMPLFYATPSANNPTAIAQFAQNRFSVSRQLHYSRDEAQRSLDIALFINGLPVFTFELKNSLTKQTAADAVAQYKKDRNPREPLFRFGRCVAHFAVDDTEVEFCTELKGDASWFLPFNRGWNDGAGNPPNPDGLKTDYLWREVLTRECVADILENYAQVIATKDPKTRRKDSKQIWPRYHQLDAVRRLLRHAGEHGAGKRYLIQHSAGSGKSNSIAWLAHQMIPLARNGKPVFDSIVVVTDRRVLDRQIGDTIRRTAQVSATVGRADDAGDLRHLLESGKKIIVSTVQKFPHILDTIGNELRGRNFAIIIDEAHSSQGGRTSAAMSGALSGAERGDEEDTFEDRINRIMASRRLLTNASYFAFTATPKNKTLELFGEDDLQPDGSIQHRAFHTYTMKQAIQEGFILDVLEHYTPVKSYYRLAKTVEDDPEFDSKKAQKKLRGFVEGHDHAIRLKAEIMVDHFHEQVLAKGKLGGEARAMVVTNGVKRAIQYFHAINAYLEQRNSRYRALVAFSGERELDGGKVTEASLNGFPSGKIQERVREDPYRFLVCADKFQTGYDEPLLHTMYVDKTLSGIKAVQTLSRLNRARPGKHDTFVLDFLNDSDAIKEAFYPFYRATILSDKTDPNKLHDLQADLDGAQIYSEEQVDALARLFLGKAPREELDPVLDACAAAYLRELDEDGQIAFKGNAKAFVRTYAFLGCVLPYTNVAWEKRSIFLNLLIPKLPAPQEEDLSKGILGAIDMESYRVEKMAVEKIVLADEDAEIGPVPAAGGSGRPEPELDRISNIVQAFNERWGRDDWAGSDQVQRRVFEDIPERVAQNTTFQNACRNSDEENARIELDAVMVRVMTAFLKDDAKLYQMFTDNPEFRQDLYRTVFPLAYEKVVQAA